MFFIGLFCLQLPHLQMSKAFVEPPQLIFGTLAVIYRVNTAKHHFVSQNSLFTAVMSVNNDTNPE